MRAIAMLFATTLAAAVTCVAGVRKAHVVNVGHGGLAEDADRPLSEQWCTLEDHTLSCGEGTVIQVIKAMYNRQRKSTCIPPVENTSVSCSVTATDTVAAACNRRRECSVPASVHLSCPKYPFAFLRVRYSCEAGPEREDSPEPWIFELPDEDEKQPTPKHTLPSEDLDDSEVPTTSLAAPTTTGSTTVPLHWSFSVLIRTSNRWWSGTDDMVYIKFIGVGREGEPRSTGWHSLNLDGQHDFERGSVQIYHVTASKLMAVNKVCFKKKTVGWWSDSWRPKLVSIYEDDTPSVPPHWIGNLTGWGVIDEDKVCKSLDER